MANPIVVKHKLSGSTDNNPIAITGTTAGASILVHTAKASVVASEWDEINLYVSNPTSAAITLSLEVPNGTTVLVVSIPSYSGLIYLGSWCLQNASTVHAFGSASGLYVSGWVHDIS